MAHITTTTHEGEKFHTAIHRGTEYTLSSNSKYGGWFVATRRIALGRYQGNGKVFDTLADVAAGCKAFGDEAAVIKLVFGFEVAQAIVA